MSNIICKPAGVRFSKEEVSFEMIFEEPYYIGVAYADEKMEVKKFKADIEGGWQELERLTDYPFIAFFENQRDKRIENNHNNLCPVILGDSAYVASGEILGLGKKTRKIFTDVFYFKQFAFEKMEEKHSSLFFSWRGRWLLDQIIPKTSAMAFLNKDGEFSIINEQSGYTYKDMWYFDTDCVNQKLSV